MVDRSGPLMVNRATINYLHLLIDICCPTDPMFFLHHAVCPSGAPLEMMVNMSIV